MLWSAGDIDDTQWRDAGIPLPDVCSDDDVQFPLYSLDLDTESWCEDTLPREPRIWTSKTITSKQKGLLLKTESPVIEMLNDCELQRPIAKLPLDSASGTTIWVNGSKIRLMTRNSNSQQAYWVPQTKRTRCCSTLSCTSRWAAEFLSQRTHPRTSTVYSEAKTKSIYSNSGWKTSKIRLDSNLHNKKRGMTFDDGTCYGIKQPPNGLPWFDQWEL